MFFGITSIYSASTVEYIGNWDSYILEFILASLYFVPAIILINLGTQTMIFRNLNKKLKEQNKLIEKLNHQN